MEKNVIKKNRISATTTVESERLGEGLSLGVGLGWLGFLLIFPGAGKTYFCFLRGLSVVQDSPSRNSFLGLRYISRKFNLNCKYISRDKSHVHPIPGIKTLLQVFLKTYFREYYLREII